MTARELADRYNRVIVGDLHGLGMSYDLFTRTSTDNHYAVVQEIFTGLYENGYIFPGTTMGAISPSTGGPSPTGTSRAPVRSVITKRPAATSATTAATSSTRST